MEAGSRVVVQIDELIALFNRRSEDLPAGLFDRRTQFVLNGVPFEQRLGRPASDPLVLMLARGPAGYRFTMKAVVYAIPDARIERGEFPGGAGNGATIAGQCWLSGHLRGSGEPAETVFGVEFTVGPGGTVQRASVTIDDGALERIRAARLRG